MKKDMISVVVPLYNYARYLGELVPSVTSQDYDNWELIIVDDASTDKPQKQMSKYLKDDRIQFVQLPKNKGYATAKNEGIVRASGEYVVIIDADDMLAPESLSSRWEKLKNNPKSYWLHAKALEFTDNKPYKFRWKKRKYIRRFAKIRKTKNYDLVWSCIHAQTVMARYSAYEKVGLYEEFMRSMSDKEMWARMYYNLGRPLYLNKFVAYYRLHKLQMHRSKTKLNQVPKLHKKLYRYIKERKNGDFSNTRRIENA